MQNGSRPKMTWEWELGDNVKTTGFFCWSEEASRRSQYQQKKPADYERLLEQSARESTKSHSNGGKRKKDQVTQRIVSRKGNP